MIKDDLCILEEQYKLCIKGEGFWCKFWKFFKEYKEDNCFFFMFQLFKFELFRVVEKMFGG